MLGEAPSRGRSSPQGWVNDEDNGAETREDENIEDGDDDEDDEEDEYEYEDEDEDEDDAGK